MISNIARVMVCASIVGLSPTVFVGAVAQAQGSTITLAVAGRYNANPSIAARGNFAAVAWSGTLGSTMDIYVATSRDGGAKWSAPVQVNATAGDARVSGEQPPRVVLVAGRGATPE
ncbi:exo-alpha-sialidase, partial [bacterium]|nr:exo-alpha-sialidase [bacterium]